LGVLDEERGVLQVAGLSEATNEDSTGIRQ
jgi:hypothetical protein